ncbi:Nucleic acid-binding [Forsythia ovata]|uniref:Nucleic acid-binding n=1 Tax=Forsythia ovata TaxID=205694 RepID=A0ABD1UVQ6_9LAMI
MQYCKCSQTKAVPRVKAYVQLEDSTGVLNANVIGEPVEKLLQCSSETLMQHSKKLTKANVLLYPDQTTQSALIEEVSPRPAKRALFQLTDEHIIAKKKIEKNTNDPNLPSAQINVKPKSE